MEEKRIAKPWKHGVIIKMLGRRIWYKALESILYKLWEKHNTLNIVKLGQDYYLVAFTSEDD